MELAFRLPDNKRLQRRFRGDDTVSKVAAFLVHTGLDMQRHVIIRGFPRKVYLGPAIVCLARETDATALLTLLVFCSH